ncbi:hypothetical protein [Rhodoblastus sp.]|uniref:hypothetical protein n=1 Tax=Rhodoblastus sp. TaxID=1962975 RepID=UPI003F9BC530
MPKLLRSSETAGCGATIELDSKEVVYVSIAQSGVIVRLWDMHGGFFKSFITNFTGHLLYNEKNVYKNTQTGMQLKLTFPQQAPELNFTNPVLSAFSNAIWNCPSAARVAAVLNEAALNAPPAEELAERIALMQAADTAQSRAERIARYDLSKRPFTRAMLTLAAELIYEDDKVIGSVGLEEPKTLDAEIDRAVLLVVTAIVGSAALGATGGLLTPGNPHNFLVATFAFIVLMSLANSLKTEGYNYMSPEHSIAVINVLFIGLNQNETTTIFKDGSTLLLRFIKEQETSQPVREFVDNITQLTYYYVIDKSARYKDKTQKLFQSLLKSLIAVA